MNLIIHNLKVAFRNLMNYKIQTIINVLSIAIGIVTLSFVHSILTHVQLPAVFSEPYADRAYEVNFQSKENDNTILLTRELVRVVKGADGLKNAEKIAVPNTFIVNWKAEFLFPDSTIRKGEIDVSEIDPEYPDYAGFRSAITGEKIRVLKAGEAIISEYLAKKIFNDKNPVGAVQTLTVRFLPFPVTIVDVYKDLSLEEPYGRNDRLYYCVSDCIEESVLDHDLASRYINVVLKKGSTELQLLDEINERLKPIGYEASLSKPFKYQKFYNTVIILVYLFSSLILIAAIIGFLRVETQLFWIRRREISLRVVNGASTIKIFGMLVAEIGVIIAITFMVAVCLGYLLDDLINNNLGIFLTKLCFDINNLWLYSLIISGGLLVISSLIAWITLMRISKAKDGLGSNMRRSRSHLFRNIMLGIQVAICLLFVCCTFILWRGSSILINKINIPQNDSSYKESIYLTQRYACQPHRLLEEISKIPFLDKMIMCSSNYYQVVDFEECPGKEEIPQYQKYFEIYKTTDSSLISFLDMDVEWIDKDIDLNRCLLIGEEAYKTFNKYGLLNKNTLTFEDNYTSGYRNVTLPIAGIIKSGAYDNKKRNYLVAISPDWSKDYEEFILIPKPGKGKALSRSVNETISRLEPEIINMMVSNFLEWINPQTLLIELLRKGVWILGIVSLIICGMSIFSSIALDTRARKKEVAIRKVNGAKSKDIYRMFGRLYLILIAIALLIAVPLSVKTNNLVEVILREEEPDLTLSPVGPIILGVAAVSLLIFLIVGWQIHKVMQVDPAKIIAKE